MSAVDIIASLRHLGLSSIALWPLLMNWRSVVSYVPPLENFILQNEQLVSKGIKTFLASLYGGLFVVALCAVMLSCLGNTVWKSLRTIILTNWHTKCSIPRGCVAYDQVHSWVRENPKFQDGIHFRASETTSRNGFGDDGIEFPRDGASPVDDIQKIRQDQISVFLEPTIDTISFWHDGAYFWLRSRHDKKLASNGVDVPDIYLDIRCFAWNLSTKPITSFLKMIDKRNNDDFSDHTQIWVPDPPFREGYPWKWVVHRYRCKRPLHTVLIDRHQMEALVTQVRSFLSRASVRWYRNKGLPIRLGYLFSGPPGTGKSSLAFALAGHFGLPVFVLNLSLLGLTDQGVEELFQRLPFHCIVLLEDIDATKLLTRDASAVEVPTDDNSDENGKKKKKNHVTLSGLLNAIDGVGAAEGRIVIMTTNHIEKLDKALIRTGRADVIVNFTNVDKKQAVDMFISTYSGERWVPYQPGKPGVEDWTEDDIKRLADEFGSKIRDQQFSPALLQQYFKDFRVEPRRAVQEIGKWMEDPRGYRKDGKLQQRVDENLAAEKDRSEKGRDEKAPRAEVDDEAMSKDIQKVVSLWDLIDCSS